MKSFCIVFLLFCTHISHSQITDITLCELFGEYNPNQLLTLLMNESSQSQQIQAYLLAIRFKIPVLNPVSNQRITAKFGYRIHPITGAIQKHQGLDLKAYKRQSVYAAADGEIMEIGYNKFLGNYLKIKHLLGFISVYGHLSAFNVNEDNQVYQGQIIGYCGDTGRTTGVHLHYAILWKNHFQNPYSFIF